MLKNADKMSQLNISKLTMGK